MVRGASGVAIAVVFSLGLVSSVRGDAQNWNPTGEGCVDPKGFLSCYEKATTDTTSCASGCEARGARGTKAYQDCLLACAGFQLASNIGCWIQSCWNQVYSCQYQRTAMDYFFGTGLVQNARIPFYPPPDSATAGACSCNLGYVYGNITKNEMTNCISSVGSSLLEPCKCCQFSGRVSNILNACPKSNLKIFDFASTLASAQDLLSKSPDKCAVLDENPAACVTQFGYEYFGDKIHNPLNLPAGEPGDEPLSNLPGNAFTALTVLVTLDLYPGYTRTITPKPFKSDAGVQTKSIGGDEVVKATATGSAAATGNGGVSGTGSAASPSKTSGTMRINANWLGWAGLFSLFAALRSFRLSLN